MCRLLGVVADKVAPVSELLAEDLELFLALADEHADGWGIAFRDHTRRVRIAKEPWGASRSERLRSWFDIYLTDMAVVHLRMASPAFAVTPANTHPFGDPRAAFAHNGDFTPATCLDRRISIGGLRSAKGDTDSERYYLAVRDRLDDGETPARAIAGVADDIRIQAKRYASLNCLLLTPDGLFGYVEHDPDAEVSRRRGPAYFGLHYRRQPGKVVIA